MKQLIVALALCMSTLQASANQQILRIDSPAQLERLPLQTSPRLPREFPLKLQRAMKEGLNAYTYYLALESREQAPRDAGLFYGPQNYVSWMSRVSRNSSIPDTAIMSTHEGDLIVGDSLTTALTGSCGAISVIHSLVSIGLSNPAEAYSGDKIKGSVIEGVKRERQASKSGMSWNENIAAHQGYGAKNCKQFGFANTAGAAANMQRFLNELNKYLTDNTKKWDCTILFLANGPDGKPKLAHVEHVKRIGNGKTIITQNGFTQGNGSTDVPRDAGENEWTVTPGGADPFKLTKGGDATVQKAADAGMSVDETNFVCCSAG